MYHILSDIIEVQPIMRGVDQDVLALLLGSFYVYVNVYVQKHNRIRHKDIVSNHSL